MSEIGYAWIQNAVRAPDFPGKERARLAPVNRIERLDDGAILVPNKLAPEPTLLQQALFALKHEGVRLDLLASAIRRIPPADLVALVQATSSSIYGRKLDHLCPGGHPNSPTSSPRAASGRTSHPNRGACERAAAHAHAALIECEREVKQGSSDGQTIHRAG